MEALSIVKNHTIVHFMYRFKYLFRLVRIKGHNTVNCDVTLVRIELRTNVNCHQLVQFEHLLQ